MKLVELVEKGELLEFGRRFKEERDKRRIANELRKKFNPVGKVEKFSKMEDDERIKLAAIVAAIALSEGLRTSQIRKILNMSRGISFKAGKEDISADVARLRYTLAYICARHLGAQIIAEVADKILPRLPADKYGAFHEFLQAVVAYHRFMGGRD